MRIYKDTLILLWRSKILLGVMVFLFAFVGWSCLEWRDPLYATIPLGNALTLSIYLFIIMMFVSFEFSGKLYNTGVAEAMLATTEGQKRKNYKMVFVVLSLYAMVMTVMVMGIVLWEYLRLKIDDPGHEYVVHIIKSIFLNDFVIMELGIVVGMALAILKRRILPYTVMCFFTILLSPYASSVAYMIDCSDTTTHTAAFFVYRFLSWFYLFPATNLDWLPRAEFGEPLLPYRFFIIGFWMFLFLTIICLTRRRYKRLSIPAFMLCVAMVIGYCQPANQMDQRVDSTLNGTADWFYYRDSGKLVIKKEPANYKILEYDLNTDIRSELSVTANMRVSRSLKHYAMTLYRKYRVNEVKDQDGHLLEYTQDGAYLEIHNEKNYDICRLIVSYRGSAGQCCYANYQGCYLPAYFPWYPRAGYLDIYLEGLGYIKPFFVDKNTMFKVRVNGNEYISNLPLKDGIYQGKCDGFTLIRGFYKIRKLKNGNKMVYPYLDNFVEHDGIRSEEECWKEKVDFSEEQLAKDGIRNCTIYIDTGALDQTFKAYGEKQIFVYAGGSFYYAN